MQSHHHQGAHYSCLLKVRIVKIANENTSVCDDAAAYISGPLLVCVRCTVRQWTILTTVTLARTNNALSADGVTAPKYVGAA